MLPALRRACQRETSLRGLRASAQPRAPRFPGDNRRSDPCSSAAGAARLPGYREPLLVFALPPATCLHLSHTDDAACQLVGRRAHRASEEHCTQARALRRPRATAGRCELQAEVWRRCDRLQEPQSLSRPSTARMVRRSQVPSRQVKTCERHNGRRCKLLSSRRRPFSLPFHWCCWQACRSCRPSLLPGNPRTLRAAPSLLMPQLILERQLAVPCQVG